MLIGGLSVLVGSTEADNQSLVAGLAADLSILYTTCVACRC